MLKDLDGPIKKLTQLCNEIYNTGYWPKDQKESIFIHIPIKPKATRCQEYRTIYTVVLLKHVAISKLQVAILARLSPEMSQTVRIE